MIYIRTSDSCRELCLIGEVLELLTIADVYSLIDKCISIIADNGGTLHVGRTAINCDREAARELSLQAICCL